MLLRARWWLSLCLIAITSAGLGSRAARADFGAGAALQARTHFRAGTIFYEAGDYARAILEYEAAYAIMPVPELLFNLGQAYRLKGEIRASANWYRRFIAAKPVGQTSDAARRTLGQLEVAIADLDAARPPAPPPEAVAVPLAPPPAPPAAPPPIAPIAPVAPVAVAEIVAAPPVKPRRRWVMPVVISSIAFVAAAVGVGLGLGLHPSDPHPSKGTAGLMPEGAK